MSWVEAQTGQIGRCSAVGSRFAEGMAGIYVRHISRSRNRAERRALSGPIVGTLDAWTFRGVSTHACGDDGRAENVDAPDRGCGLGRRNRLTDARPSRTVQLDATAALLRKPRGVRVAALVRRLRGMGRRAGDHVIQRFGSRLSRRSR